MDLNVVINQIKSVTENQIRIVPMTGQNALDGKQQIEIFKNGNWVQVMQGLKRNMAEDIIRQAHNRVILG